MTVHVGFIEGEDLRVRGRTLPAAAMAVTVGGSTLDISTRDIASGLGVSIHAGTLDATLVAAWRARAEGETVLLPIEGDSVALQALLQRMDADPRDCPDFCVNGPYLPQEAVYGDQERVTG